MNHLEETLPDVLDELQDILLARSAKYGPKNIAEFGMTGLVVRLGDKMARLRYGVENHEDESLIDTLMDVAGYALIGILWNRGLWPGSEVQSAHDVIEHYDTITNPINQCTAFDNHRDVRMRCGREAGHKSWHHNAGGYWGNQESDS